MATIRSQFTGVKLTLGGYNKIVEKCQDRLSDVRANVIAQKAFDNNLEIKGFSKLQMKFLLDAINRKDWMLHLDVSRMLRKVLARMRVLYEGGCSTSAY
ncbi:MAG: hypothetical protein ACRYE7_01530 [Janthinobacterium lividum]